MFLNQLKLTAISKKFKTYLRQLLAHTKKRKINKRKLRYIRLRILYKATHIMQLEL